jgi:hypothetical protein
MGNTFWHRVFVNEGDKSLLILCSLFRPFPLYFLRWCSFSLAEELRYVSTMLFKMASLSPFAIMPVDGRGTRAKGIWFVLLQQVNVLIGRLLQTIIRALIKQSTAFTACSHSNVMPQAILSRFNGWGKSVKLYKLCWQCKYENTWFVCARTLKYRPHNAMYACTYACWHTHTHTHACKHYVCMCV